MGNTQHKRYATAVRGCKINEMISAHAEVQLKREWLMRLFLDPHFICMWGVFCFIPLLSIIATELLRHTAQHTHTPHKAGNMWACLSVCECYEGVRAGVSTQFALFTFTLSSLYRAYIYCAVCILYINLEFIIQSWTTPGIILYHPG